MTARVQQFAPALEATHAHALRWLESQSTRRIPPSRTADELLPLLGGPLPDGPTAAEEVVDLLAREGEPGLMAMPAGRFYGWVMGGTLPAAMAVDWLVSAWDQNTGLRAATPTTAACEEIAGTWLLDVLGLPAHSDVGFVTGGTMANFTCLAAARQSVLARAGWDVNHDGLFGAPRVRVLVGQERHESVDLTLRYLGLGAPTAVAADDQGRILPGALKASLAEEPGCPTIVCLQAGNLHSGAFDPFREAIETAHASGAWVHVDGAFGLFAAASPDLRPALDGYALADSWATDAHKTLNVPFDCGIAVVADPQALRSAVGAHTAYLIEAGGEDGPTDPFMKAPEFSRRARGVPVWAALRSLGRHGVTGLVDGLVANARALAAGISEIPGATILNDVAFTQVCVAFEDDARTVAVTEELLRDGTVWMSGSLWRGRWVMRISVCNWSTDADDVTASIEAVRRAAAAARA